MGLVLFSFDFSFSCVYSGPAGPQLRGPYPGSSPPGQQMRGPMMANNSGPTGGQQPRPPYFAAGGGPTSNQGPAIRGPAGIQQSPFVYFCVCLVSASNCVLVVMSLVRVDSVKKSKKKKLAGEILNHPSIPFISLGFSLSLCVCAIDPVVAQSHTHTEGTIKRMSDVG